MSNLHAAISVSVIIPAYNAEDSIFKCLESAINQTVAVLEILIINDGSTDETEIIIKKFISDNPQHLITLYSVPNGGPSAARNIGIQKANGDLIAFLDADDYWMNDKIKLQLEVFYTYRKDVIIVGCKTSGLKFQSAQDKWIAIDFDRLLWGNVFSTPTVVTWRHILLETNFNVNQKYSEDFGLWLQLAKIGKCILVNEKLVSLADKPVYGYSGLSSQMWKMTKGEFANYRLLQRKGFIKRYQYYFFCFFAFFKYLRRVLITRFT